MRDVPHFTLSGRQTTGVNDRFGGAGESHGLGRRPSRADLTPVDAAAIAAWQLRQNISRAIYHKDSPRGRQLVMAEATR